MNAQQKAGEGRLNERSLSKLWNRALIAPILYLLVITAAELVTTFVNPIGGIIFHAVILFALLVHASLAFPRSSYKLYLSLCLAPLIRILSLSMPLTDIPQIYWYVIIAVPLLIATFLIIRMLRYRRFEVGLTLGKLPTQFLIGATGIAFGFIEYQILKPEPLLSAFNWWILPAALLLLVATGFAEELVFRGVMQRSSLEMMGIWGLLYVTVIFAVLHIGYKSAPDVFFVFAIGLFFALMVKKTGSLLGASLSHGLTNVFLYLIIPFL